MGDSTGMGSYGGHSSGAIYDDERVERDDKGLRLNPDAAKWDVREVGQWLESRNLHEHVQIFKDNDVNGNLLLRLDKDTLVQELRIPETTALEILDQINVQENKMVEVEQWTEDDVVSWITALGLGEHASKFRYHNVTGSLLLELNKTDIIEDLKVDKFGQRQTLLEEIAHLRKRIVRGGPAGRVSNTSRPTSSADELAMLEKKKAERLKAELDALKRKVSHARDAEARAKVLARQAEGKAGDVEKQLESLETKLKQRKSAPLAATAGKAGGKKAVVAGWIDQCTFKPLLNKKSLEMTKHTEGKGSFMDRMVGQQRERDRKLKELIKKSTAQPSLEEKNAAKKKKCFDYFKLELGWDTSAGVKSEDIDSVLEDPKRFGLELSASQRRAIKKMVGAEQYLALYDQFCIKGFVERQKQDLEQRKALGGKHSDEKKKELEYNAAAAKYMCDRFKWSRVDDARVDDLIDNAQAYELELAETELAAFRSLKGDAKTRAVYKALQTQAFLQRNEADIRKREVNQQMGWAHSMQAAAAATGHSKANVEDFLHRYHEDLRSRDERKLKLVEKVQQDDPNFRECTFSPNILSSRA